MELCTTHRKNYLKLLIEKQTIFYDSLAFIYFYTNLNNLFSDNSSLNN